MSVGLKQCLCIGQSTINLPWAARLHRYDTWFDSAIWTMALSICLLLTLPLLTQDRQAQDRDKRTRLAAALQSGQRIIIDLDFADLMTDQVIRHLF